MSYQVTFVDHVNGAVDRYEAPTIDVLANEITALHRAIEDLGFELIDRYGYRDVPIDAFHRHYVAGAGGLEIDIFVERRVEPFTTDGEPLPFLTEYMAEQARG